MKRNTALKALNPIIAILLVNQLLSGFFSGSISHAAFEIRHEGGGIVLAIAILLHVILNWNWIKSSYFLKASTRKG